jgi:DnaJ homolog subfamily C member 13
VTSLQALAKLYKRYHKEIGEFEDLPYIMQLTDKVIWFSGSKI